MTHGPPESAATSSCSWRPPAEGSALPGQAGLPCPAPGWLWLQASAGGEAWSQITSRHGLQRRLGGPAARVKASLPPSAEAVEGQERLPRGSLCRAWLSGWGGKSPVTPGCTLCAWHCPGHCPGPFPRLFLIAHRRGTECHLLLEGTAGANHPGHQGGTDSPSVPSSHLPAACGHGAQSGPQCRPRLLPPSPVAPRSPVNKDHQPGTATVRGSRTASGSMTVITALQWAGHQHCPAVMSHQGTCLDLRVPRTPATTSTAALPRLSWVSPTHAERQRRWPLLLPSQMAGQQSQRHSCGHPGQWP